MRFPVDENLRQYATDEQWKIYEAYCETGSKRGAADLLGKGRSTVQDSMRLLKAKAGKAGYVEPAPMVVKGVSRFTGPNGETKGEWVKTARAGRDEEDVFELPDPRKVTKTSKLLDQQGK